MTVLPPRKDYLAFLTLIAELARDRMELKLKRPFSLSPHPTPTAFVFGSLQAIQIMASPVFHLVFKTHFDSFGELELAIAGAVTPTRQRAMVIDFFREHANLTTGTLKQHLNHRGLIVGASVPFVSSGFDEIIYSDPVKEGRINQYFKLSSDSLQLSCSIHLDVYQPEWLQNFRPATELELSQAGEVEFL